MEKPIITCKNCGNQFSGKFCNNCGEKVYTDHDKSILHYFEDAFHFITHFEGTFFNTLKAVFTRPGKLSLEYCNGVRKKYFRPLSFFMVLVITYLIFPFFTGLNTPLKNYLNRGSLTSKLAAKKAGIDIDSLFRSTDTVLAGKEFNTKEARSVYASIYMDSVLSTTPQLSRLEEKYDKTSEKTSKLLLLILLPLTALVLWVLSLKRKKYFFDHLVLATELNSFFLLFTFLLLPLGVILLYKLLPGVAFKIINQNSLVAFSYIVVGIYMMLAFLRFYNDRWWWALIKTCLLIITHYYIVQLIYKLVLFVITLYLSA
ncbi:MAG: DUF3667 domain-containing protein [Bacteroidota bacterium]